MIGLILTVTITKTTDGKQDYIQIMSDDVISVNVVLVADSIKLRDDRSDRPQRPPRK
ncbi:hypothetical protein LCGC14_2130940 [marine sediment metagenome]|uniref:Uncharacterized protein n=1 Tax=marine sediment metagenome TaxID=412755 RepID=A0A0F9ENN1_9ZZZZ